MASDTYISELSTEASASHSRLSPGITLLADASTCAAVILTAGLPFPYSLRAILLFSAVAGFCAALFLRSSHGILHPVYDTARTVRRSAQILAIAVPLCALYLSPLAALAAGVALLCMPFSLTLQRYALSRWSKRGNASTNPSFSGYGSAPQGVPALYAHSKRLLDLTVSFALLVLLAPLLLLLAVLIRLTSSGPAFFVQERAGASGTTFRMYKFRSMLYDAAKYERSPITSVDPRITPIGRFLRRTSLDELPQLLNVFLGDMSLVGPRPEMPFIVREYTMRQRQRLQVIPGITGLWQLSKDRAFPIHENLHHDLAYIRHRSLSLDIAILIHTLLFAMQGGI